MHKRVADAGIVVGLAAGYVLAARTGLAFDAVAGFASLVWPPAGIALAALLLLGTRYWPGILLGAFISNYLADAPLLVAIGIGAGNTLEAVVGVALLQRVPGFGRSLETVRDVMALILCAVFTTVVSATIGVISLYLGHVVALGQFRHAWSTWWIGDLVAELLVAPLILVWAAKPRLRVELRWPEGVALGVMTAAAGLLTFFTGLHRMRGTATPFQQSALLLFVLLWATLRFGQRGSATTAFVISAMAVAATTLGYGPFVEPRLSVALLPLQTFMATVASTFLLLGASVAERRLALEDARRAQEEATRANLAKSEFLAVMSHELRTPLNAIAGFAQLLETDVHGPLNDNQKDDVKRIIRNEKQLLSIIDEVLGFVSAEKGHVTASSEDVQVSAAFDAVEPIMHTEFEQKHFVLRRNLAGPPLAVHADPKSLQQVLVTLLSNASKYTNDGGMITLGADREGASVRIWVSDTGVGISRDEMKRVFEPFFQAERGTTRRYSGIGLGLSIARALARSMEGELTIASTEGRGTTASVVLPAA